MANSQSHLQRLHALGNSFAEVIEPKDIYRLELLNHRDQ